MVRSLIPLSALLISDAFLLIGHGLLVTLLPLTAAEYGFSDFLIAMTGAGHFLGFVFGCLATPFLVQRVGHIRSFAVVASVYAIATLLFGWTGWFLFWFMLRFFCGASISGLWMIVESWLNECADPNQRGSVLSFYSMLNFAMITLAQQLLNIGDLGSGKLFSLAALFLALSVIPVCLTLSLTPSPLHAVRFNIPKLWEQSHIGLIGSAIGGLIVGAFWSLAPVYANASGFTTSQVAWFMSATILGGAVFQMPLGRWSDNNDRRYVLMHASFGGFLASLLLFAASISPDYLGWPTYALAFLWGGFTFTGYALVLAHANDNADGSDFVEIGSTMLIVYGVSSAIGAPLASIVMSVVGPSGLFLYAGFCHILYAIIIIVRRSVHKLPGNYEDYVAFQPNAGFTTPASYEMDPRSETEDEPLEDSDQLKQVDDLEK